MLEYGDWLVVVLTGMLQLIWDYDKGRSIKIKRINDIFETYQNCKKVFGAIMSQEVEVKVEKKFASVSFEEIEKISQ